MVSLFQWGKFNDDGVAGKSHAYIEKFTRKMILILHFIALQDKQSVPKFSSFKAPPKPQAPSSRTDHSESRRHDDRKSRHSSRRREEERSRSPRRSDRRERRGSPVRPIRQRSPRLHDRRNSPDSRRSSKLGSEALRGHTHEPRQGKSDGHGSADDPTADLFIVDLKGDRHNLTYGATHRYAVPKYKRWGKGHVLGADQRYRIDRDHLDSDSLVLRIKDSRNSDTSKSIRPLAKRINQPERLLRLKTEDQPHSNDELDQDFISFDSITNERAAGGDSADERHAYRSIHGKAKEEDDIPQHMELVLDENIHESDVSIERRARHAELSRAVNSNPADVSAWLRLIDHQDILILGPDETSRPLTYNEQQSVADVKLSLYEKAIKQSAASPHKDRLLLGRLQEGAHIWDTKKLLAQWNGTLQENSECISLWVNYLNFRQTDFQNFDFEQLMATFYECLELNSSSDSRSTKNHVQCYLFLRMTLFLREAGYLELAVGLWQAVLEFTYFKPESQPQESESFDVLASFRSYWEDESPRIGESESLTWRGWADSRIDQVLSYALREYQHDVEISSLMTSWERAEKEQTLASRLPSRTLDQLKSKHAVNDYEQYIDDAYSVVLFSDLERILKLFRGFDSPDEILDGFLYFCHLPHLTKSRNAQTTRLWSGDNFLENGLLDLLEPGLSQWMEHQTEVGTSVSPLRFPHSNFLHTTSTFFAGANDWFGSFASWHQGHQSPNSSVVDREWAQMVLRCLLERGNSRETFDDELAEYILGLIFAWDPKKAKKYAKTLLKKWTSSLRVCNALALIEWRNNSQDAAVQVWSSTISWSQKLSDDLKIDSGILWNSWAWELLHQGNHARASYILHAIPVQSIDKDVYNQIQSTDSASNPTSTLQVRSVSKTKSPLRIQLIIIHSICVIARRVL